MNEYKVTFLDVDIYPEIKRFPNTCIFDVKPSVGESIQIGEHHFKVVKILHIPTVTNINYTQFIEPTILFVEYD